MKLRMTLIIALAVASVFLPTNLEAKSRRVQKKIAQAEFAAKQEANISLNELNSQLLSAVSENNARECQRLIELGADANVKNANLEPALLLAVKENYVQVVKTLLDMHADCCAVNQEGIFPLAQVVLNGDKSVPKELDDEKIIYVKSDSKMHNFLASLLLTSGAKIDQQDHLGHSALHFAAAADNIEAINFLVDHEANANIKDIEGRTPLMYACSASALESCKQLLMAKADINATDRDGQTSLMFAVQKDQPEMVKFLMDKGALVNAMDDFGATAVKIADALGNRNSSECLRETGEES